MTFYAHLTFFFFFVAENALDAFFSAVLISGIAQSECHESHGWLYSRCRNPELTSFSTSVFIYHNACQKLNVVLCFLIGSLKLTDCVYPATYSVSLWG